MLYVLGNIVLQGNIRCNSAKLLKSSHSIEQLIATSEGFAQRGRCGAKTCTKPLATVSFLPEIKDNDSRCSTHVRARPRVSHAGVGAVERQCPAARTAARPGRTARAARARTLRGAEAQP